MVRSGSILRESVPVVERCDLWNVPVAFVSHCFQSGNIKTETAHNHGKYSINQFTVPLFQSFLIKGNM